MANVHVNFLKLAVKENVKIIENLAPSEQGTVTRIEKEMLIHPVNNKSMEINRIFVDTPFELAYREVGWVHHDNIDRCMRCNSKFGVKKAKHNCFCCGFVVCLSCGSKAAVIEELDSTENFRICKHCFTGEVTM
jgi:hypothetical protein